MPLLPKHRLLLVNLFLLLLVSNPTAAQPTDQATEKSHTIAISKETSLQRFTTFVSSVAFSPDGQRIASAGGDQLKVTNVAIGKDTFKLKSLRGMSFFAVAFSPDGRFLAGGQSQLKNRKNEFKKDSIITTFFYRGEVLIADAQTGAHITKLNHNHAPAWQIAFSPDSRWLAVGSGPLPEDEKRNCEKEACEGVGTVLLYDTSNWNLVAQLRADALPVKVLAFSPDGHWLAGSSGIAESSGSSDEQTDFAIFFWEVPSGKLVRKLSADSRPATALAFSRDGKLFASASRDRSLKIWDTGAWQLQHKSSEYMISYDELTAISSNTKGKKDKEAIPKVSWLASLTFSRDGQKIFGGGGDGIIRVYDSASGKLNQVLKPSDWPIVAWDRMWNWGLFTPPERSWRGSWPVSYGALNSMSLSPDGTMLATGNNDGKIRLLSLE